VAQGLFFHLYHQQVEIRWEEEEEVMESRGLVGDRRRDSQTCWQRGKIQTEEDKGDRKGEREVGERN